MAEWYDEGGALNIKSGAELLRFDLGTVLIGHKTYTILTGYEGPDRRCFWCGGELKGKLKRYCYGHMQEYYRHFDWTFASNWARKRAGYKCEVCGRNAWLEVHHIVPLNGSSRQFTAYNLPWNLIVLCRSCHLEVGAAMRPPQHPAESRECLSIWNKEASRGQYLMFPEMLRVTAELPHTKTPVVNARPPLPSF